MSLVLQEGALVAGRYRVSRCIATGAMGAVYEVLHLETDRRRALKVMLPDLADSEELRDRFKLEARIAGRVESDFIVEVFDAGIDDATRMPFLVMELLRGEELGRRLKRMGRFAPDEALTYLHQTALALEKTHKAAIIHRDLKPGNLFLTDRDDGAPRIKVLDFGIAKLVAESTASAGATASIGTPLYMAPEQFLGIAVSPATDIFSLGMIAYTFLVGRAYWADAAKEGGNALAFAMVACRGPQEPATACAARAGVDLPPAFDPWFARITAFQPEARFPTAMVAVAALAEALGQPPLRLGQPSSAALPVAPGPTDAPSGTGRAAFSASAGSGQGVSTRRTRLVVAAAAVALLGGGAAVALRPGGPTLAPAVQPEASAFAQRAAPATATADPAPAAAPTLEPASTAPAPGSSASAAKSQPSAGKAPPARPPAVPTPRATRSSAPPIYSPD